MRLIKKKTFEKVYPFFFILLLTLIIFRKFIFQGLIPAPLDLLVAFNFPWYSGGFTAYDPWTTYKGFLNSDVIRQGLPWRILTISQFKKGKIPFWNPYNFCGNPLMANFQSAVFYPLNVVHFFFSLPYAWAILEMLQIVLGMGLMYLFLRKLKLSKVACFWGSVVFMFNTFMIVWLQLNIVGHTLLWLPLALYAYESFRQEEKQRYLFLFICSLVFSFLAGHPLSFFYVSFIVIAYIFWTERFSRNLVQFLLAVGLTIFLVSFQLVPTVELFSHSMIGGEQNKKIFELGTIPFVQIITLLAPDYFGNEATFNKWGKGGTGDLTPFVGILTLVLGAYALFCKKRKKMVTLMVGFCLLGLLIALPTPFNLLLKNLKLPVLSSTSPARSLILFFFGIAVLSSFGWDVFLKQKIGKLVVKKINLFFFGVYGLLAITTLFFYFNSDNPIMKTNFKVSLRNLVLPSLVFLGCFLGTFIYLKTKKNLIAYLMVLINLLFFLFNFNKILSFTNKKFFYPKHILFDYLRAQKEWRFHGYGTSSIGSNFQIPYQVYSPSGYDVLRIKDYGELVASSFTGKLEFPENFSRADADFPVRENFYRERLFDLMGVKYIVNKVDEPKSDWEPRYDLFPTNRYKMVWQKERFQVYERKSVYPRAFLVADYLVENDKEKIIEKIYDQNLDLRKTVILSGEIPQFKLEKGRKKAEIVDYQPNKVRIKTQSESNSLLFLSDAYYPGWKAYIDSKETPIYKANYAFRAVFVPQGEHLIEFSYQPSSFYNGLKISFLGLLVFISWLILSLKRRTF